MQRFDFHLTRAANDDYTLLVVADEHVSGRVIDIPPGSGNVIAPVDSVQFRNDFMPRLVEYADSLMRRMPVYGLNLGDMTHSEYWFRNKTGMPEYLRLAKDTPFLMYHVIGNHDHCHKYENDYEAEAEYRRYFGPTYYSFNIGKVHYVVLDDMLYHGRNKYDKIIAPEQLSWLYKDLRALDPEIRQLVVACHVPLVANNGAWDDIWYNLKNKDELFVLLQDYDVTIMTGDWHTEGTTRISDGWWSTSTRPSRATGGIGRASAATAIRRLSPNTFSGATASKAARSSTGPTATANSSSGFTTGA